jgi:hypothetical protein
MHLPHFAEVRSKVAAVWVEAKRDYSPNGGDQVPEPRRDISPFSASAGSPRRASWMKGFASEVGWSSLVSLTTVLSVSSSRSRAALPPLWSRLAGLSARSSPASGPLDVDHGRVHALLSGQLVPVQRATS